MHMANFEKSVSWHSWTMCLLVVMIKFHRPGVASLTPGGWNNAHTASNMFPSRELTALMALRANWSDPNQVLRSWDSEAINPCAFNHITCNPQNRVVRIDLEACGLSGSLIPEIAYLENLAYLILYSNNLSGPIPAELGTLQNLISLDISGNYFSGSIPNSLGELSSIRDILAKNNSLSGPIPVSLTNLANLERLDFEFNELTGEVPNNGSFALLTPASFEGNPGLCGVTVGVPCPGEGPLSLPTAPGPSTTDSSGSSSCWRVRKHQWSP